ncbi:MAG: hypothetical protein AABZ12_00275 [Planctomycetota bacterium]
MFTKESLELIRKNFMPRILVPSSERAGVYFTVDGDGKLYKHASEPAPRDYKTFTLDDFIRGCTELRAEVREGCESKLLVACGCERVTGLLDERDRRQERITLPLPHASEYALLRNLRSSRTPLDQKRFISMLRIELSGCVDRTLIGAFRRLKFSQSDSGESVVENAREALSRSVKKEAAAGGEGGEIAEECTLHVCIYRDLVAAGWTQPIRCAIETDLDGPTFTMIPMAGELETAQRLTDEKIRERLAVALPTATVICGAI